MNIFNKFYCRVYQIIMRCFLPFLPYREPVLLKDYDDVISTLKEENLTKILLVTDKNLRELKVTSNIEKILKDNVNITIYDNLHQNTSTENVEQAVQLYEQNGCEGIIAVGGGSVIDCAKAVGACAVCKQKTIKDMKGLLRINKRTPILIAIPTTAGTGSEATLSAVITDSEDGKKFVINDFDLIPDYALLDETLTVGLPKNLTATAGMDALTHAIEAYIGRSTTKFTRNSALKAIKLIFENLETTYKNGNNLEARKNMLEASHLAGLAFSRSYVGYVHAIAHSLGRKYGIAHAQSNAVILPTMLRFYGKKIHKKLWKIAVYCDMVNKNMPYEEGAKMVIEKIEKMNRNLKIKSNLSCIKEEDISKLAKIAAKEANPLYPVPVLYSSKNLEKVLHILKIKV